MLKLKLHPKPDIPGARDKKLIKSFGFKGRIEGTSQRPSPHDILPDPNDTSLFLSECQRELSVLMHTNFVASNGWEGDWPAEGDIVKVDLQPGEFSFNLQRAIFDKIHIESEFVTQRRRWGGTSGAANAFFVAKESLTLNQIDHSEHGCAWPKQKTKSELEDHQIWGAMQPVGTFITSPYGLRYSKTKGKIGLHAGMDYNGGKRSTARTRLSESVPSWQAATKREDIEECVAVLGGTVVLTIPAQFPKGPCVGYTGLCSGYGGRVWIRSVVKDKGDTERVIYHLYAHLEHITPALTVTASEPVIKQGAVIGHIGSTGGSTGPHLHFEVREGVADSQALPGANKAIDPLDLFGWALVKDANQQNSLCVPQDQPAQTPQQAAAWAAVGATAAVPKPTPKPKPPPKTQKQIQAEVTDALLDRWSKPNKFGLELELPPEELPVQRSLLDMYVQGTSTE